MKVLLLAGGFGTRLSEETHLIPKPMVEIGGKPILWHIMKIYAEHGYKDFVVLLGYKGYVIKEYFANYFLHTNDVTIDLHNNSMEIHNNKTEDWKITLLETGLKTMTGGRLSHAKKYIGDEPFMFTYGDGVANVDISKLVEFHKSHGKLATMTSVQPEGRYGAMETNENDIVTSFKEKPKGDGHFINGGFFVCQPEVLDYIDGDHQMFEREPMEKLVDDLQLATYKHYGFWQCMDTQRDKRLLEDLWDTEPKWKIWE